MCAVGAMTTLSCEYCSDFRCVHGMSACVQQLMPTLPVGGDPERTLNVQWYCGPCCFKDKRCEVDGCDKLVDGESIPASGGSR